MGAVRLTLFQDRLTGQMYQARREGNRDYVIPCANGKVQVFGQSAQTITPPLPPEALEAFKKNKHRP